MIRHEIHFAFFRGLFPFPFGKCVYWTRRDTLLIRTYSRPCRAVERSENIVGQGGASSNVVGIICPPGWGRATTTTRIELAHARLHELACVRDICHWTIYSPTTFLERCRKVVREKWLEKSGSRNLVREKWLARKKVVLYYKSTYFQVGEKWLTRKKNTSLKNHFSRTTFLHFSRKVVAE